MAHNSAKVAVFVLITFLCLFFSNAEAFSQNEEKKLYIYGWFYSIPTEIIDTFQKETGIKVYFDVFSTNDDLETKMLTGSAGYDLVFPSGYPHLQRQIKADLYRPLNREWLSNISHIDPFLLKHLEKADPQNQFAIPFLWGVIAIGFNKKILDKVIPNVPRDSLALLFDPEIVSKLAPYGVYLFDSPIDLFLTALLYLGLDPQSTNPDDLQQAENALKRIRPYITKFDVSLAPRNLAKGEAAIVISYSGDIVLGQQIAQGYAKNVDIGFSIPKEGTFIWVDTMAIPKDAPHPRNAHRFMNFLMRPDIIAKITNHNLNANANFKSLAFVDPELKANALVYPRREILKKATVSTSSTERERTLLRKVISLIADVSR